MLVHSRPDPLKALLATDRIWMLIKKCVPRSLRQHVRNVRGSWRLAHNQEQTKFTRDALLISHSQISGFELVLVPGQPHRPNHALDSSFYDRQHQDLQYRENNWLLDQLHILKRSDLGTVIEIGCGNGRFLRAVAPHARKVIGIDWARSPELSNLPFNVDVLRLDVATTPIPSGDLICSADVLEHLAPRDVEPVVAKLISAGPCQHHVIACYDDGHSHLSILPPAAWLAVFRKYDHTAYLSDVYCRRNDPAQIVCIVSNLRPG